MHRGNWENLPKINSCQGKHREFGNFAKTQRKHRIVYAEVVNYVQGDQGCDICSNIFQFCLRMCKII